MQKSKNDITSQVQKATRYDSTQLAGQKTFKKLVSFIKKGKVSKFFLSLAAQNKSSFDFAFFLGKTKTNM